jgi:hypothetical protein
MLGLPRFCPYPSCHHLCPSRHPIPRTGSPLAPSVAFFICIHVHHACSMCSFPCHVYASVFTMSFASFRCCFLVPVTLRIVRIRSTTPVRLLHGFDLLPSGISGKITVTLDLTTNFAMLVVSILSLCRASYHLFSNPPKLP